VDQLLDALVGLSRQLRIFGILAQCPRNYAECGDIFTLMRITYAALYPANHGMPRAAVNWSDPVQLTRRIEQHAARRQFEGKGLRGGCDHPLAALISGRFIKELGE
jgi:hypothetical protein